MTEQPTIIREAVGLARPHGHRNTIESDLRHFVLRMLTWLSFRAIIPLKTRQWFLFCGLPRLNRLLRRLMLRVQPIGGASMGDTFENDLLKLVFQATAIALIADNTATTPLTNLFVALHTADPGEAGTQTTSEITYTSYIRATVARTSGGWTVTTNSVSPVANIDFAAGTGGSGTAAYFSVGTVLSGAGKILFSGTVTPNIVTGNGVTPRLTTASAITLD